MTPIDLEQTRRTLVDFAPRRRRRPPARRRRGDRRERGVALVLTMTTIAILAVLLTEIHQTSSTAMVIATTQRDSLRAEYAARSALNLTRLLFGLEPEIRAAVAPFYQALVGRPPPELPVWRFAGDVLTPFCDYEASREAMETTGFSLDAAEGLGKTNSTCEIFAAAENSKINVNDPLFLDGDEARRSVAMQMMGLMGGYQSPSPYDPIFDRRDASGNITGRLDVISATIDWWDQDTERTIFDPGAATIQNAGGEDDIYASYDDPYRPKNAPFDSIEEFRLIRGVGDDFWATFVEPSQDDPSSRTVTIYGSGSVNPNEAPPEVLLARTCSILTNVSLCTDPNEAMKFITLINTARGMAPVPFFTSPADYVNFITGAGGERELYPMLRSFLGADNPLLFTPITVTDAQRPELERTFVTSARIIGIDVTGFSGRARVKLRTVVNFHDRWTPPPPNAGSVPPLGIFHYYRVE